MSPTSGNASVDKLTTLLQRVDEAAGRLAEARDFAKPPKLQRLLDLARRVMLLPGGCAALEARAPALEEAGVFAGSDWAFPQILEPALSPFSLRSAEATVVVIEALSDLRLLAVSFDGLAHPLISAEQAHHHLTQVLALNLTMLFTPPSEAERAAQGRLAEVPRTVLQHLAQRIGYEHVIDELIGEIWRILRQRPIQVAAVKQMVTQIAICRASPGVNLGASGHGAERLVSSLYGPTQACREDPGLTVYRERLEHLDPTALQGEATGCARAMHDTGLVSPYHAVLMRFLLREATHLLPEALGLSGTGRDSLLCYQDLVLALIENAVFPETAQGVYGLALLLDRGILYQPAVAPALWGQLSMPLSAWTQERLQLAYGDSVEPRTWLLEGVLTILGQPLGVGQGNNPTCQSARALSMWAYNDPDYLLQLLVWAARDDEVLMHFEGQSLSSQAVAAVKKALPLDLDAVSLVLVPHLDYLYNQMGELCAGRDGDPHRWINPELHGWWVGRGFCINVDVTTGQLHEVDDFLRYFYAYYHPLYNGNQPLIHPQPAGVAVTDSAARFIGWHAITILRVALDPSSVMRVYFYNPNNDSGQDWGDGVAVSTADNGEFFGEASLPFEQFASRLYIFHYDPLERRKPAQMAHDELERVVGRIERSWGADRLPIGALQAATR